MKEFQELSNEEKGALLLAHHEGHEIQICIDAHAEQWVPALARPLWAPYTYYRVTPKPAFESTEAALKAAIAELREVAQARATFEVIRELETML